MKKAENQRLREAKALVKAKKGYQGQVFSIRSDAIHYEDGSTQHWDIVLHSGGVAVLPVTAKGDILLVRQWRRAVGQITLELPAGLLEKGEEPHFSAQRELQEETGYKADKLTSLGGFYSSPGFCNEFLHLFMAEDLVESPLPPDEHEGIDLVEMSLQHLLYLIDTHQMMDAKTICGILQYDRWKKKQKDH